MPDVVFLIGSGVSCGADLPGTKEITKALLQPLRGPAASEYEHRLGQYVALLTDEVRSVNRTLGRGRHVNYEELAYLCRQIQDSAVGEFENPAVSALHEKLARRLSRSSAFQDEIHLNGSSRSAHFREEVLDLSEEIYSRTEQVLSQELDKAATRPDPFKPLLAASLDEQVSLDVFTLNHDCLIEQMWGEHGIDFEDGFRPVAEVNSASFLARTPQIKAWDRAAYGRSQKRISLAKLHGSLDWWSYPNTGVEYLPPQKVAGDPSHIDDPRPRGQQSRQRWLLPPDRLLLIGTFNKMLAQARGDAFLDLLCLFRGRLQETNALVISGYGFGDKGINGVILEWLSHPGNRACWIEPRLKATLENARPTIWALERAGERGQLTILRERFARASWRTIRRRLGLNRKAKASGSRAAE